MGTQTPSPGGQPQQSPPGKPGVQPPDDGSIEQDVRDDSPAQDDDDEDEAGKIQLPGEGGGDDQADRSRSADNP